MVAARQLNIFRQENNYEYAWRCINCDHVSYHTQDIENKRTRCHYFVSQYGGGGSCDCGEYRPAIDFSNLELALITVGRSLPKIDTTALQIICSELRVPIPRWQRVWRR